MKTIFTIILAVLAIGCTQRPERPTQQAAIAAKREPILGSYPELTELWLREAPKLGVTDECIDEPLQWRLRHRDDWVDDCTDAEYVAGCARYSIELIEVIRVGTEVEFLAGVTYTVDEARYRYLIVHEAAHAAYRCMEMRAGGRFDHHERIEAYRREHYGAAQRIPEDSP